MIFNIVKPKQRKEEYETDSKKNETHRMTSPMCGCVPKVIN